MPWMQANPPSAASLTQLDRQGLLKKVHGGATLVGRTVLADEPPMAAREEQSVEEKRLIARAAAAMITEKDFIFLDAGSTTLRWPPRWRALPCRLPM